VYTLHSVYTTKTGAMPVSNSVYTCFFLDVI